MIKVREFEKIPKNAIGKNVLRIIISINCKQLILSKQLETPHN